MINHMPILKIRTWQRLLINVGTCLVLFGSSATQALPLGGVLTPYYEAGNFDCVAASTAVSGSLDRFLQVLAFQESGGNPKAEAGGSSASGKYQYINGTWRSVTKTYYGPGSQFSRASGAPEAVQDATAYLEYTVKFQAFDGDLFKLAVSHFYPKANTDPSLLDRRIGSNVITVRQYAQKFVDGINSGVGKDIPLYYSTAPDFQTWLSKVGGTVSNTDDSPPQAASSCSGNGVPADSFVFYSQYDSRWIDYPYGSSTMGPSGCGPASVAMIVATLVDKTVTPVEVADFGTNNGAYIPDVGSDHQKMLGDGPENWGLQSESLGTDMDRAITVLKGGGLVLAAGTGPVPFTTDGHILVLRGLSASGDILVGDPAHPESNSTEYPPNVLAANITALWGVTK